MSRTYEISVCPFCGAQCTYDGGYEGEGWIFSCEHQEYSKEYGQVEPLTLLIDVPEQADIAVKAAAPALEKQRRQKAIDDADRAARELAAWERLTPAEQERRTREAEAVSNILRDCYRPLIEDAIRGANRQLWAGGYTAVIPKFVG